MPIHIDIRVNSDRVTQIHIGRLEQLKGRDEEHEYKVIEGRYADWEVPFAPLDQGVHFTHRYGDGLLTCVAKGLEALDASPD